jgi:hypothetical protein
MGATRPASLVQKPARGVRLCRSKSVESCKAGEGGIGVLKEVLVSIRGRRKGSRLRRRTWRRRARKVE